MIKIKDYIINIDAVRYVQINEETKSVHIVFSDEDALIFVVDGSSPLWLNTPQFEKLKKFFSCGEYDGCSCSIDILDPLNDKEAP